jgi:hypothetical protein
MEKATNQFANKGKRWADEEDARLKQEVHEKTFEQIAAEHGRTKLAIELRLGKFSAETVLARISTFVKEEMGTIVIVCKNYGIELSAMYKVLLGMKPETILKMIGLVPADLDVDALTQKPGKPIKESPEASEEEQEQPETIPADPEEAAQKALDKQSDKAMTKDAKKDPNWMQAADKPKRRRHYMKNAGKPWLPKELAQLRTELEAGTSLKDIAIEHGRSVTAVAARVGEVAAAQLTEQGKALDKEAIKALAAQYGIKPGKIYPHVNWAALGVPQWTEGGTKPPVPVDASPVMERKPAPVIVSTYKAATGGVASRIVALEGSVDEIKRMLRRLIPAEEEKETA